MVCLVKRKASDIQLQLLEKAELNGWLKNQSAATKRWLKTHDFQAQPGQHCLLQNTKGEISSVIVGFSPEHIFKSIGYLPYALPENTYTFSKALKQEKLAALVWGLGAYRFTHYKAAKRAPAKLSLAQSKTLTQAKHELSAVTLTRDLINTPAADMGPVQLAKVMQTLAKRCQANFKQITGAPLAKQCPAVHAVGKGAGKGYEPRMLELTWGKKSHPKVTLAGKGVCFDTGGLDIKPARGMQLMKKDMGGAANVLGLAQLIMDSKLPIRLRVLIPAVENAVSGEAFRPSDIIQTRKGLTVEIGNTDAEGRLVLADALCMACEDKPDLLIDLATLTGACRVAVGTDISALFSNDDSIATALQKAGDAIEDPIWRLPLFEPYDNSLNSPVADLNNISGGGYGGGIVAALFLQRFITPTTPWVHLDLMAWNIKTKPGRPEGGDAMALRAVFAYLQKRFG